MIDVRKSAKFIASKSKHVQINQRGIAEIAQKISRGLYAIPTIEQYQPFVGKTAEQTALWCLLLDAVNFCFWPDVGQPQWEVDDPKKGWVSGYWALISSMVQSARNNVLPLEPTALKNLSLDQTRTIFMGRGEIPFVERRHKAIVEIGEGLRGGSVVGLIDVSEGRVSLFLDTIISRFPSFRDESVYRGRPVGFYKRAQLLTSDLSLALMAYGIAPFHDLFHLTAFADYKIPQLLRAEGAIEYDETLSKRIDSLREIPSGSPEEIEIRGVGVVHAVELLKQELVHRDRVMTSWELDNILWTESKRPGRVMAPHHKTRTIFY